MSSLKEIKTRIASVKNTLKITTAMKMVASAKLHKAQTAISGNLPYTQQLYRILGDILHDDDLQEAMKEEMGFGTDSPVILHDVSSDELPSKESARRVALVVFSSNSSLCGSFNANIIKKFKETMSILSDRGYSEGDVDIYAIGHKFAESARNSGYELSGEFNEMSEKPDYQKACDLSHTLLHDYINGNVSQVIFIYSHFVSMGSQPVVLENYLPLPFNVESDGNDYIDYILEPSPLSLAKDLLPKVLKLKVYTVMLDASASEHAARTIAMQVASDNAQSLIAELTLVYNKSRQQAITAEILDIVGGTLNS